MNILRMSLAIVCFSLLTLDLYSQSDLTSDLIKTDPSQGVVLATISSTGAGGLWSATSTWAGGVVPGAGDNVIITGGTAVVIDTDVAAANLTVGDGTLIPGVLTFDPLTARSLTVNGDLTISGGGSTLTTPATGTITGHTVTVGGNLTNNGVLDLSTNNNLAGAGLIFKNASNNTFGGPGTNNIRTITIDKGTAVTNTLELTVSNLTVQGSAVDGPSSGYLTLTNGTFKISGTFAGDHRTFPTASYDIPVTSAIWLNNPNYKVTAQNGNAVVSGQLKVSAGVYNVGTTATDMLRVARPGLNTYGLITMEGGSLNVSGAMRRESESGPYRQSGGTTTTCIAGNFAPCFDLTSDGIGGKLVIQTPAAVPNDGNPDFAGGMLRGTVLTFGNADTPGTGTFTAKNTAGLSGFGMTELSISIDTTAGPHTVRVSRGLNALAVHNLNIGTGGTLDLLDNTRLWLTGITFTNNGTVKLRPDIEVTVTQDTIPPRPSLTFSGSGSFSGPIASLITDRRNIIFGPGFSGVRTRDVIVAGATVTNASLLTIGFNDHIPSSVTLRSGGSFDSAPTFDLGTGGQKMVYYEMQATGFEINPARELVGLTLQNNTVLNIAGGDLTLNGPLEFNGQIITGSNRLRHLSGGVTRSGFPAALIYGTVVRRFSAEGEEYTFPIGETVFYAPVKITATTLPSGPVEVAVGGRRSILPGLDPQHSADFRWDIAQTGTMTSGLELTSPLGIAAGHEPSYRAWRSVGGGPFVIFNSATSISTPNSSSTTTAPVVSNLTGSWGVSERPPGISINGSVLASNGGGIRNATVTLSGGHLAAPRTFQTGSFGAYFFNNVEAGMEYTVTVSAKRYRFAAPSQTVSSFTNLTNLNFTANPPEEFKTSSLVNR